MKVFIENISQLIYNYICDNYYQLKRGNAYAGI